MSNAKIPIDHINRQKESFWPQLEIVVYLDQPIDQSRPDLFVDLSLQGHVIGVAVPLCLDLEHVLVDFLAELRDVVYISESCSIGLGEVGEDLVLAPLVEHLQFLMETNTRELFSGGWPERLFTTFHVDASEALPSRVLGLVSTKGAYTRSEILWCEVSGMHKARTLANTGSLRRNTIRRSVVLHGSHSILTLSRAFDNWCMICFLQSAIEIGPVEVRLV
jgi:hypothetical protein